MRSALLVSLFGVFLCAAPIWPQQIQLPSPKPPAPSSPRTVSTVISPAAPQDPQAVTVLNQVLVAAGGSPAIKAVTDYTATGNITYHWNQDTQGSVTVRGLGFGEVRMDAYLSNGVYSQSIYNGQFNTKTLDGAVRQYPHPDPVPISDAFPYQPPMFPSGLALPYAPLLAVLSNPRLSISYKGVTSIRGQSVQDIQVQEVLRGRIQPDSMAEYHTIDFFIDPNTSQIVMTQDMIPKNVVHQIRYANYSLLGGVLIPLSISEEMGGQKTWDIQLTGATLNTGLQDSDFELQ